MTTAEDAFQTQIDAAPDDWTLRSAFADWLLDQSDPRGPGYAEMARLQVRCVLTTDDGHHWDNPGWYSRAKYLGGLQTADNVRVGPTQGRLPDLWFEAVDGIVIGRGYWKVFASRREADDAAALAYARMAAGNTRLADVQSLREQWSREYDRKLGRTPKR